MTIRSTIITHRLGPYNINYYNYPLIRAENANNYTLLTRAINPESTLYFINSNLQKKTSYLLNFSFFINEENAQIYFLYKTYIWSMHKDKSNIFTHFKYNIKRNLFSFIKIYINFPYLEEVLKILKYLTLKIFLLT